MVSWKPWGAVVVGEFAKARAFQEETPLLDVVVGAVPFAVDLFCIGTSWIGRKEDASRLESEPEFAKNTAELAHWNMEETGVGEDTVK